MSMNYHERPMKAAILSISLALASLHAQASSAEQLYPSEIYEAQNEGALKAYIAQNAADLRAEISMEKRDHTQHLLLLLGLNPQHEKFLIHRLKLMDQIAQSDEQFSTMVIHEYVRYPALPSREHLEMPSLPKAPKIKAENDSSGPWWKFGMGNTAATVEPVAEDLPMTAPEATGTAQDVSPVLEPALVEVEPIMADEPMEQNPTP